MPTMPSGPRKLSCLLLVLVCRWAAMLVMHGRSWKGIVDQVFWRSRWARVHPSWRAWTHVLKLVLQGKWKWPVHCRKMEKSSFSWIFPVHFQLKIWNFQRALGYLTSRYPCNRGVLVCCPAATGCCWCFPAPLPHTAPRRAWAVVVEGYEWASWQLNASVLVQWKKRLGKRGVRLKWSRAPGLISMALSRGIFTQLMDGQRPSEPRWDL